MEYRKNIGEGVQIIQVRKSVLDKFIDMGKAKRSRELLKDKGIPSYSKAQKKQIKKEVQNYFNSLENKYGKQSF